jgi:hypothetical protein
MPASDAYATEIGRLETALAKGELTVESDGDRVTYRSIEQLQLALNYFRGQAAQATPGRAAYGVTVAAYERD